MPSSIGSEISGLVLSFSRFFLLWLMLLLLLNNNCSDTSCRKRQCCRLSRMWQESIDESNKQQGDKKRRFVHCSIRPYPNGSYTVFDMWDYKNSSLTNVTCHNIWIVFYTVKQLLHDNVGRLPLCGIRTSTMSFSLFGSSWVSHLEACANMYIRLGTMYIDMYMAVTQIEYFLHDLFQRLIKIETKEIVSLIFHVSQNQSLCVIWCHRFRASILHG